MLEQPGDSIINNFISVSRSDDRSTVVAYVPTPSDVAIYNPGNTLYNAYWFDPVQNKTTEVNLSYENGILRAGKRPTDGDAVLVLQRKEEETKRSGNRR